MSSLAQILTNRTAAGADYVTKLNALRDAWVELAAHDRALESRRIGHAAGLPSFGQPPDPIALRHAQYTPTFTADWHALTIARMNAIVAAYPTPDPEE